MNILVIGAGGVGTSMAAIAESRNFFRSFTLADVSLEAAQRAIDQLTDQQRFTAVQLDARSESNIVALIRECDADFVVNACDPRLNEQIFNACFTAGVH